MKEKLKKFKELWKIPRFKALIKLGLYLIFVMFLISFIKTNQVTNIPKSEKINSYEFTYNITYNENNYVVTGVHFNGNEKLTMNNYIYYYVDNVLNYQNAEAPNIEVIPFSSFNYELLNDELTSKIKIDETFYNDRNVVTYQIDDGYFNTLETANVTAEYQNNKLMKVTVLLTETDYKIEIEYKNFNTITKLDINV